MKTRYLLWALLALAITSCQGGKTAAGDGGDTVKMKYAQLLTIVKHGGEHAEAEHDGEHAEHDGEYAEVTIANPWKEGTLLHRYILVPKGEEGNKTVARLAMQHSAGARCLTDTVRTPVENSAVFTSPHCQLMYELGCGQAIRGVCDLDYINIPDVKKRATSDNSRGSSGNSRSSSADNNGSSPSIVDCGSSMAPDIERIISLKPEAILLSPFENSGGYGKLDKLHIPLIEVADYMEASPLGRAEWMKFYGMLFEKSDAKDNKGDTAANKDDITSSKAETSSSKADSLFAKIETEYLNLKAAARKLPAGLSVLTERKTGSVWYVPGGQSTIGILLKDANARYIFSGDQHSGSLAMSPEQILAKAKNIDVWAFKYFGGEPLSRSLLLQEYAGYKSLAAFGSSRIYQVDTSREPYFEITSFHPEVLLREFILLSHPADNTRFAKYDKEIRKLGKLRFYKK